MATVVEEKESGEESSILTVLLEQIAKVVAASLALVGLTSPVVRMVWSELDLF